MRAAWLIVFALALAPIVARVAWGSVDRAERWYWAIDAATPRHPETPQARAERLWAFARAVAEVPMPAETVASAIAETGLSPEAHAGLARGDNGRSWCLGQVNEGNPLGTPHVGLVGLDEASTRRCVEAVSRTLVYARGHCRGQGFTGPEAAFALYATGKSCEWSGARARVRLAAAVRERAR